MNAAGDLPYEWWTTTFKESIAEIGTTLLVLSPWNDPVPLTRASCLFEIMCSIEGKASGAVDLQIALPPREHESLREGLEEDFNSIMDALVRINAERATAFKETDKASIFRSIREGVGFTRLNAEVKDVLRAWYVNTGCAIVDAMLAGRDDDVTATGPRSIMYNLGVALKQQGDYDRALEYYEKDLAVKLATLGPDHPRTAITYNAIGQAWGSKGN